MCNLKIKPQIQTSTHTYVRIGFVFTFSRHMLIGIILNDFHNLYKILSFAIIAKKKWNGLTILCSILVNKVGKI